MSNSEKVVKGINAQIGRCQADEVSKSDHAKLTAWTNAYNSAWRCSQAPRLYNAKQVDSGMRMVVATDIHKWPHFLSGRSWCRLGTFALKHVSDGSSGTWGTDAANRVHELVAGNFRPVNGLTMQQVDAGGDGQVVGVRPSNYRIYCMREVNAVSYTGVGSGSWTNIAGTLKYLSCGPLYGCWGVHQNSQVYDSRVCLFIVDNVSRDQKSALDSGSVGLAGGLLWTTRSVGLSKRDR
ncbi:unnamed protein product [Pleuronectes platessa]|uniref:Uncharacterized protein n=1 Tax=Pleuronectes platessa TaxID=8262 RepID=A0A9N7U7E0_PLEPL|nr:unnamed protein product [Pleuronectes platessa]